MPGADPARGALPEGCAEDEVSGAACSGGRRRSRGAQARGALSSAAPQTRIFHSGLLGRSYDFLDLLRVNEVNVF